MDNIFNANLRRIRKEKGITQEQLAEAVGVTAQAVSKWETNSYPDAQLLPAVAKRLGVTIYELFGKEIDNSDIYEKVFRHKNAPAFRLIFLTEKQVQFVPINKT